VVAGPKGLIDVLAPQAPGLARRYGLPRPSGVTGMTTNEWVVRRPAPRVRPFVERYIGYRIDGYEPAVHRGLPSRHMTFIVSIGPPIDVVKQTSGSQEPRIYRAVLSGLQAAPALISHDGSQQGVAIELTPLGSRALFGMPARALWDLTLELREVVGPIGDELWERLQELPGWRQRFATCDAILARLTGRHETPAEMVRCWQALVSSHGQLQIDVLARQVGYSRQHLARRFRAEFGLGPKLAARIIRFERANRMLRAVPSPASVADVAATCGYADQAHLARDFSLLAGCSPTQWLRDEELPILQGEDLPGVRS
jgi:AraC-like DNA-binding protein